MRQGELWMADMEPVKGSEQGKKRPVVIISGNTMNTHFPVVVICPLTSNMKNYMGCVAIRKSKTNGLSTDSEIITFQVRTLSKERLSKKIGSISNEELQVVLDGLNDILSL